ncbi:S-layer homology domain-containing protein [Paenibacillaceae bacterium WGS1546]|uniref:S-layer homology domain-containing protein n=1 Tax=Cohnella sp. WGS1546 TaxID=3366810 RepID=UPI00372D139A
MKKFIVIVMALGMLMSILPLSSVAAASEPSKWAKAPVEKAIKLGLVPERLQSNYQQPITRGEFAELLVQTMFANYKYSSTVFSPWTTKEFLEKVKVDAEFIDAPEDYIKIAYALGGINGKTETIFAPNDRITRQEAATIIANTVHTQVGFVYKDPEYLEMSDYKKIAEWAKPAVHVVSSADIMSGIGGKFDYSGHFTREQSIATMLRIYDKRRVMYPALRGNIIVSSYWDEYTYTVGKDYVRVHYEPESIGNNLFNPHLWSLWTSRPLTKERDYDRVQAAILYTFSGMYTAIDIVAQPTFRNEPVHIDYDYLTMKTFGPDYLLEFKFKDIPGYSNYIGGYTYGFPEKKVTWKVIE